VPGTYYELLHSRDHLQIVGCDFNDGRPDTVPLLGNHPFEIADDYTFSQIVEEIAYVELMMSDPSATYPPTAPAPPPTAYPTVGTLSPTPPTVPTKQPTYVPTLTLQGYAALSQAQTPSPVAASAVPPSPGSTSGPTAPASADGADASPLSTGAAAAIGVLGAVAGVAALGAARRYARKPSSDGSAIVDAENQPVRVPRHMSRHGALGHAVPVSRGLAASVGAAYAEPQTAAGGWSAQQRGW